MTTSSSAAHPGTSRRLSGPKYAPQLQQHLETGEDILDTADANVEILDYGSMKMHYDIALVLTPKRLIAFRGRGLMANRAPFIIELENVTQAGVTRQFNVNVEFRDRLGAPGLWKLHLGGEERAADHWMSQIHDATMALVGGPPPNAGAQGPSQEWQQCRARLQGFCDALASFAQPDVIGQPFGEELGLEEALSLVSKHFISADDVRLADTIVAGDLLAATGAQIDPHDLREVMGESSVRSNMITVAQAKAADSLAGAATTFLGQFDQDGENMWDLWKRRDDVAAEFLCWHTIGRLRLATVGKLESI